MYCTYGGIHVALVRSSKLEASLSRTSDTQAQCRFTLLMILRTFYTQLNMLSKAGHSVLRQARAHLRSRTSPTSVASLTAISRLLSSLAVLEQKDGKLNAGSLGAITAAQKLGGPITAFIAGGNIKGAAEEAAKVAGVEKIITVDNTAYDKACPHIY